MVLLLPLGAFPPCLFVSAWEMAVRMALFVNCTATARPPAINLPGLPGLPGEQEPLFTGKELLLWPPKYWQEKLRMD